MFWLIIVNSAINIEIIEKEKTLSTSFVDDFKDQTVT